MVNRIAFDLYQESLSLEQSAALEYIADIARFSKNAVFKLKLSTIQRELRIGRRKTEAILTWLQEIKILVYKPQPVGKPGVYFFDFHQIRKHPELIFRNGIPATAEYEVLTQASVSAHRLELFKSKWKKKPT